MALIDDLLRCVDAYCAARDIKRPTLSTLMLNDSTTIRRIADGGSLTVRNFERCMRWLSTNWPADTAWPDGVMRPPPEPTAPPHPAEAA